MRLTIVEVAAVVGGLSACAPTPAVIPTSNISTADLPTTSGWIVIQSVEPTTSRELCRITAVPHPHYIFRIGRQPYHVAPFIERYGGQVTAGFTAANAQTGRAPPMVQFTSVDYYVEGDPPQAAVALRANPSHTMRVPDEQVSAFINKLVSRKAIVYRVDKGALLLLQLDGLRGKLGECAIKSDAEVARPTLSARAPQKEARRAQPKSTPTAHPVPATTPKFTPTTSLKPRSTWDSKDDALMKIVGYALGVASHCKLGSETRLMSQAALYIGFHSGSDGKAEEAGRLIRASMEEVKSQTAGKDIDCGRFSAFADSLALKLTTANARRAKIVD